MSLPPSFQWLMVIILIVIVILIIRWLITPKSRDGFNEALVMYSGLKNTLSTNSDDRVCIQATIETASAFQQVIRRNPKDGDGYVLLANTYFGIANRFNQNGIYSLGVRLSSAVMMYWSQSKLHTRNKKQAKTLFAMLAEVQRQMVQGSYSPSARNRKALEEIWSGNYQQEFETATEPENLASVKAEALAWLELEDAMQFMEVDQYQDALHCCGKALQLCPNLADVFFLQAQIKVSSGDFIGCVEDIETFEGLDGPNQLSTATRILAQQRVDQNRAQ